jgi:hypothetical protein
LAIVEYIFLVHTFHVFPSHLGVIYMVYIHLYKLQQFEERYNF